jgi:hypothetical protein
MLDGGQAVRLVAAAMRSSKFGGVEGGGGSMPIEAKTPLFSTPALVLSWPEGRASGLAWARAGA